MPRSGLGLHSFDPKTLSILYAVFDDAVAELDADITDVNRHRIHTAVAKAIVDLAKSGQLDANQLKRYAVAQGRSALVR